MPGLCSEIYNSWLKRDYEKSMRLNQHLYSLNKALFLESSPCPVKYALSKLKRCKNILRLPLTSIKKSTMVEVDKALEKLDLI